MKSLAYFWLNNFLSNEKFSCKKLLHRKLINIWALIEIKFKIKCNKNGYLYGVIIG